MRLRCEVGPRFPTWGHCASFSPSPSDQHRKWPQVKPTERRALQSGAVRSLRWAAQTERAPRAFLCPRKCGPTDPSGTSFLAALEAGNTSVGGEPAAAWFGCHPSPHPHPCFSWVTAADLRLSVPPHTCALTKRVFRPSLKTPKPTCSMGEGGSS